MNNHTLTVLEYPAILDRIVYHCRSVPGKRKATALRPSTDPININQNLDFISEMNDLFEFDGGPPSLEFGDLGVRLEEAASSGAIIEPKELLEYSILLKIVYDCRRLDKKYEKLNRMLSDLVYPESLHRQIDMSVDASGDIKDSASPELKKIRRELSLVKTKLDSQFEKFLRGKTASYLTDNLFTIREGRYVLPVREGDKGQVKGIIHDRSSSGVTFFIEPYETVELNNRHRELETSEREEINRILRQLSEMLFANIDELKKDIDILSRLDFVAGCSRLSRELKASRPLFSDDRRIDIINGRHPILILNFLERRKNEVEPLSLKLSDGSNVLVITGPNTGGKTVALKTIGILSLMAASGLFVPADKDSHFILFNDIFADIGDEQSIDSSLSTYSSHLSHIKTALDLAQPNSLVLLDELGAGTDPDEGSAIGQGIVEKLSRTDCFAVVTTHHGKLKALAGKVRGVVNGSMEFDTENLNPTFKFRMGVPGSSFAVEIARKLGLPEDVTRRAWELIDKKEQDLTRLITELNQKLARTENDREAAAALRLKYESLARIYVDKIEARDKEEKEYRKTQLRKTEEIVKKTQDELDQLLKKAKKSVADREAVRRIKKDVSVKLQQTREDLRQLTPVPDGQPASGLPGEMVYITGIDADGEVLEPADSAGRVRVKVGNVTMLTELKNLIRKDAAAKPGIASTIITDYAPEPGMDLDIRGLTFDEAEPLIQNYIDDAGNAGFETVTIIHGKGTGALRKKVQDFLAHNQRIASFRLGNWDEGSSGVTILVLKTD